MCDHEVYQLCLARTFPRRSLFWHRTMFLSKTKPENRYATTQRRVCVNLSFGVTQITATKETFQGPVDQICTSVLS